MRLLLRRRAAVNKQISEHTLSFNASSFSSLRLSRSFSLRLRRCSSACSAREYLWRALCFRVMPNVAPPWLGTLVKPWQRGKLKTVTWSKRTLLCTPASLGLLRMGRTGRGGKDTVNIRHVDKHSLYIEQSCVNVLRTP